MFSFVLIGFSKWRKQLVISLKIGMKIINKNVLLCFLWF